MLRKNCGWILSLFLRACSTFAPHLGNVDVLIKAVATASCRIGKPLAMTCYAMDVYLGQGVEVRIHDLSVCCDSGSTFFRSRFDKTPLVGRIPESSGAGCPLSIWVRCLGRGPVHAFSARKWCPAARFVRPCCCLPLRLDARYMGCGKSIYNISEKYIFFSGPF